MANWVQFTSAQSSKSVLLNLDRAILIEESTNPPGTRISFARGEDPQSIVVTNDVKNVAQAASKSRA